MLRKFIILTMAFAFATPMIYAQGNDGATCGFDKIHKKMLDKDPNYQQKVNQFNDFVANDFATQKSDEILKVPLVFHIMETGNEMTDITDEQVREVIRYVNHYYRKKLGTLGDGNGVDVEVEFALAVRDPDNNCTNGIVRVDMTGNSAYMNNGVNADETDGIDDIDLKNISRWDPTKYYNVWLVSEIDGNEGGGGTQGYAYFPSSHGQDWDGTLQLVNATKDPSNRTLAHELGHALYLYHTFEGDDGGESCPPEQNGCGNGIGDCCEDTPPHKRSKDDCDTGGSNECDGNSTNTLFVHNYMDYSSNVCQNMFTANQKTRVIAALTNERASFLESEGNQSLVPVAAPSVDFMSDKSITCSTGESIRFFDLSSCVPNTYLEKPSWTNVSHNWTFDNGTDTPISSTSQNPIITFNNTGMYNVTLEVNNGVGTNTITKNAHIFISESQPATACQPESISEGNIWQTVYNVSFNTIDNNTNLYENTAYTDFSCSDNTIVSVGETYELSVSVHGGNEMRQHFEVYIDFNNDGVFGTNERVHFGSADPNTTNTVTTNVTIPENAVQNTILRMRVYGEADDPISDDKRNCSENFFIGDVEDYGVMIKTDLEVNAGADQQVCAGNSVTLTAEATDGATISWDNDVVDGVSFTPTETTTYTVTATLDGNTATDEVTVVVLALLETLSCPDNLTGSCDISELAVYQSYTEFVSAGGSVNTGADVDITSFEMTEQTSDGESCPETFIRTYQLSDECGSTETCSQSIVLNDEEAPTGNAPTITVQCAEDLPAPNTNAVENVSDNCTENPTVEFVSETSDNASCSETITRTYSITDDCGNETTIVQTLIINDDTAPVIECEIFADTLKQSQGDECPDYLSSATATDNCTENVTITQSPEAGSTLQLGDNTVTMTATDDCGNTSTCEIIVMLDDDASLRAEDLQAINIYPNPTTGDITVELNGFSNNGKTILQLHDVNGRKLMEMDATNESNLQLDLTGLAKGMYHISISSNSSVLMEKITKM